MNYEQHNTQYARSGTQSGFTLIELVVAIGVMAVVIVFAGVIFKASITAYRVASAQAEIMQKFRAITDQLNNDFRGLRKNAPMFVWFQLDPNDPNKRLDQIGFFAEGGFQSIGQWTNQTIVGNLARIQYGQAQSIDPRTKSLNDPANLRSYDRLLARKQHILTADTDFNSWPDSNIANFSATFSSTFDNYYEHDFLSLSQWEALTNDASYGSTNVNQIIAACFISRPVVDLIDTNDPHMLMAEKVGSFSVQWSYYYEDTNGLTHVYWWPSIDPAGTGTAAYSDFGTSGMNNTAFGFYFNTSAQPSSVTNWFLYGGAQGAYYPAVKPAFPQALKFTFKLYDSRGVFRDGQTFTHIIYIGD